MREYLQDPAFRQIEGFPIGEDEDILALSDPPYYTACPNPFLPAIVEEWQREREIVRRDLFEVDGGGAEAPTTNGYHREPFAADVSEGKNDPIYNAHSYHTKVPHKAIMRYILHYAEPGDIVFDGFCGTGMTGVAAQLCGDRKAVQGLGYLVDAEGVIYDGNRVVSRLGVRKALLNDLSPAATFIAYNYNTPVDVTAFEREAKRILREAEREVGWMYETWHPHCDAQDRVMGRINYSVWSDIFICTQCGSEALFWNLSVDPDTGYKERSDPLLCKSCGANNQLSFWERSWDVYYDSSSGNVVKRPKRNIVLINYNVGKKRYEKMPDREDINLISRIGQKDISFWFPAYRMPDGDEGRRNDDIGMTHVHHFYTNRNLITWSWFMNRIRKADLNIRASLLFWAQSVGIGQTVLNRYLAASYSQVNRYLKGTLYVAPFISEVSPWYSLTGKIKIAKRLGYSIQSVAAIQVASCTNAVVEDSSLDYIFIDPPFGANIDYSELNFIWESWFRIFTNNQQEAIVSRRLNKSLGYYHELMTRCFEEYFRILKSGRWMTVEFHNSRNSVWNAIQEAIGRVGFVIADVRTLDKKQMTMQQMTSTSAVKQDLVISAYKPDLDFVQRFEQEAGNIDGAWDFVRQHLRQLPVVVEQDGVLETLAERQDYLLFDRMVAFHIQRGATVPLSAAEFYAGLRQKFVERDGMFFLPDQAPAYDRARLRRPRSSNSPCSSTTRRAPFSGCDNNWTRPWAASPRPINRSNPSFCANFIKLNMRFCPN